MFTQKHRKRHRLCLRTQENPYILSAMFFRSFHSTAFQTVPIFMWFTMALSKMIIKRFLFLCLYLCDWWCDVLGFVPISCVSSSTLLSFQNLVSYLQWLLYLPACLLSYFPWFWQSLFPLILANSYFPWLEQVQDSTFTGVHSENKSSLQKPLFTEVGEHV